MKQQWAVTLLIVFFSATLDPVTKMPPTFFIVWNVGQGLWSTLQMPDVCLHFDLGGEHAPHRLIKAACGRKQNKMLFSHWDWDHISFMRGIQRSLPDTCIMAAPAGQTSSKKQWLMQQFRQCPPERSHPSAWAIWDVKVKDLTSIKKHATTTAPRKAPSLSTGNDLSRVFLAEHPWRSFIQPMEGSSPSPRFQTINSRRRILIPGDSPGPSERIWAKSLDTRFPVWLLILGHHGSRTSTSNALLNQIPGLRMAVASSRFRKYGHPHPQIVERLRSRQISLLRTEDWGTLIFELPHAQRNEDTSVRFEGFNDDHEPLRETAFDSPSKTRVKAGRAYIPCLNYEPLAHRRHCLRTHSGP